MPTLPDSCTKDCRFTVWDDTLDPLYKDASFATAVMAIREHPNRNYAECNTHDSVMEEL